MGSDLEALEQERDKLLEERHMRHIEILELDRTLARNKAHIRELKAGQR